MRVVLFGATGPTGKFLIDQALELGYQVVVYGRNASKAKVSNDAVTLITGRQSQGRVLRQNSAYHEIVEG
jgi:uncharacterized protein YbjT (DUF2867 family)